MSTVPSSSKPLLPYGRQTIDDQDIAAVVDVLKSDWLTTGPKVREFEAKVAEHTGTAHAIAVSNGTAALHAMMDALEVGPGDEVIVPTITFAATANCVVYQGATPVLVDVDPDTLLIDPRAVEAAITERTRAIIAVDYAGQPCDYHQLQAIADGHALALVSDACHSLGGSYRGQPVGSLAVATAFSFHPVKLMTTGEGGMVTTDDDHLADCMRVFRNHGISSDHHQRQRAGTWKYEMRSLGYNYRLSDIQCALGISQLTKLKGWVERRQEIAAMYDAAFEHAAAVEPIQCRADVASAYHLYVVRWKSKSSLIDRRTAFERLRNAGIAVNVHYEPVHLHPFYRERFNTRRGQCPVAESAYEELISLPMYPAMSAADVDRVIETVRTIADESVRRAA
ncbi:MAG: UDP-4-amino-4,6-dideoxy-N-acetyl-beta-L-altrosamine transaminase [Pirellulales bacterium]|nr:UDP-4-amino-4,6-dideoxy-N-acetyl-beta-L-altrosamine transaminase [Pirellulales bacterium]